MPDLALVVQVDVAAVPHERRPTPEIPLVNNRPGVSQTKVPAVVTGLVLGERHAAKSPYGVEVGPRRKLPGQRRVEDVLEQQAILIPADQPVSALLSAPSAVHATPLPWCSPSAREPSALLAFQKPGIGGPVQRELDLLPRV